MLFVVGLACLAAGAIITAAAAMVYQDKMGPALFWRRLNSQVLCVALATFIGCGLMILFLFVVEFKTQTFGLIEAILSLAMVALGVVGVSTIAKRHRSHQDHPHISSGHPA